MKKIILFLFIFITTYFVFSDTKPLEIVSDKMFYFDKDKTTIFVGNVIMTQENSKIYGDSMTVYNDNSVFVEKNVRVVSDTMIITGGYLNYKNDEAVVTDNPVIRFDTNIIKGDTVLYYQKVSEVTVLSAKHKVVEMELTDLFNDTSSPDGIPVNITCNYVKMKNNVSNFYENVVVKQDTLVMNGDFMEVNNTSRNMVLKNNVKIIQNDIDIMGDTLNYYNNKNTIVITGKNPAIVKGKNRFMGDIITYDVDTKNVILEGKEGKQVHAIIYPESDKNQS